MKTRHYFYSPIYGKLRNRDICYFYVAWWDQKSMNFSPDGEYWKGIYLPYCSDRELDMNNPVISSNIKNLIGGICLLKYFNFNIITREPIIIKAHDVYSNDKLESVMDFLSRIPQFQEAMFSDSANRKDSYMPTTDRMRHSSAFQIFKNMREREFDFITNIVYQTGLFQKIDASMNDGESLISVKYARSVTKNHISRVDFSRFRANEIYNLKVKDTDWDKRSIRPVEFDDFIFSRA